MPYYQCRTCFNPAEDSARICFKCRRKNEERAEEQAFEMLEHNADCNDHGENMREQWRKALWYAKRLQKRIEVQQQWLQSKDDRLATLREQLSEMQAEQEMRADRNVG